MEDFKFVTPAFHVNVRRIIGSDWIEMIDGERFANAQRDTLGRVVIFMTDKIWIEFQRARGFYVAYTATLYVNGLNIAHSADTSYVDLLKKMRAAYNTLADAFAG
jgi:hypothetical protein